MARPIHGTNRMNEREPKNKTRLPKKKASNRWRHISIHTTADWLNFCVFFVFFLLLGVPLLFWVGFVGDERRRKTERIKTRRKRERERERERRRDKEGMHKERKWKKTHTQKKTRTDREYSDILLSRVDYWFPIFFSYFLSQITDTVTNNFSVTELKNTTIRGNSIVVGKLILLCQIKSLRLSQT